MVDRVVGIDDSPVGVVGSPTDLLVLRVATVPVGQSLGPGPIALGDRGAERGGAVVPVADIGENVDGSVRCGLAVDADGLALGRAGHVPVGAVLGVGGPGAPVVGGGRDVPGVVDPDDP